jgi:hypothetical protein
MSVTAERPLAAIEPAIRESQLSELWAMTTQQRVAAMWDGRLTRFQLGKWSSRHPHEVPLLGGEFAWIVMRTPEWCEAADSRRSVAR